MPQNSVDPLLIRAADAIDRYNVRLTDLGELRNAIQLIALMSEKIGTLYAQASEAASRPQETGPKNPPEETG